MTTTGTWAGVEEEFLGPGVVAPDEVPAWLVEAERGGVGCVGGDPVGDLDGGEYAALLAEADAHLAAGTTSGPEGSGGAASGGEGSGWVGPAEELAGGLGAAAVGVDRAGVAAQELVRVFDEGLVAGVEAVGVVRARLEGVGFALAAEAAQRGLPSTVGLVLSEWLRVRCPWLSRVEASQIQEVVVAGERHWGRGLAADVAAGVTPVRRAAKVARTIRQLVPVLDVDRLEEYAGIAVGAAADPGISDVELEVVCKKLLVDLLDKEPRERAKATAQQLRRVGRRPLGQGMTRFTVDAPEGDAALLEGVLNGALAAPAPEADGTLDGRSWGQRAYDALLMVVNRGMSNPGAPPSSGRASVMVTIKADPVTGRPVGAGVTALGQVLDPEQVGRFACLGDVTPIALGEFGEPLALGRTVRLATPGQFKALMVRDGKCTYPGCSVPGTWCDAHHLIWWCRGGGTDIAFLVLLCPRHHTLVHDKDLQASVVGSVVTWHV